MKKTKPEKSITAIDLDETALPPPTPERCGKREGWQYLTY